MKKQANIKTLLISALAFGLLCGASTVLAQEEMPGINPLARLERALTAAGAPELSAGQTDEISTLVTDFRDAHPRPVPNSGIPDARMAYEEAILSGDSAGAASQAESIAKEQLDHMVQRQADAAVFAVSAIGILDSAQVDALTTQMGTRGFVRLILSLANRPGGPGMMGRQGGPGLMGRQGGRGLMAGQAGLRQRAGGRLNAGPAIP